MLNDQVIPWYEEQEVSLLRILTDRGSEYCGNREHHEYELYLDLENIEHTRTKTKSPKILNHPMVFVNDSIKQSKTSFMLPHLDASSIIR